MLCLRRASAFVLKSVLHSHPFGRVTMNYLNPSGRRSLGRRRTPARSQPSRSRNHALVIWTRKHERTISADAGIAADLPATFVHLSVMEAAQEQSVVEVGLATIEPGDNVVCIGECRRSMAVGKATSAVANCERPPLVTSEQPALPAVLKWNAFGRHEDSCNLRVTRDAFCCWPAQQPIARGERH